VPGLHDFVLCFWVWKKFIFKFFLQGKWLPTLRNLVAQINETFSQNFQQMAVAGEVSLGLSDGN
jgi:hypothetical protein